MENKRKRAVKSRPVGNRLIVIGGDGNKKLKIKIIYLASSVLGRPSNLKKYLNQKNI